MTIKKSDLEKYQTLSKERADLSRKAKTIEVEMDQLETAFESELKKTGKASCKRFGWLFAFVPSRVNVAWKEAFVAECGAAKASDLQKAAAAKNKTRFQLTPPCELSSEPVS